MLAWLSDATRSRRGNELEAVFLFLTALTETVQRRWQAVAAARLPTQQQCTMCFTAHDRQGARTRSVSLLHFHHGMDLHTSHDVDISNLVRYLPVTKIAPPRRMSNPCKVLLCCRACTAHTRRHSSLAGCQHDTSASRWFPEADPPGAS